MSANTPAKSRTLLIRLLCAFAALCLLAGCGKEEPQEPDQPQPSQNDAQQPVAQEPVQQDKPLEIRDFVAQHKLDMQSASAKLEVTVKTFVDGDTTHFNVDPSVVPSGVFKARYLAVNTPESTGKIEEYGKKASSFTRSKLESAVSIILESEGTTWEADSTGDRYLAWVWYKTAQDADYRLLNLELLQEGLAIASSSANNQYGDICMAAINQAKAQKLYVYSGQKDPDFYYGDAIELTLQELRTNTEAYSGMKVAFNGIVTMNNNNSVYVEAYDAENDLYYGMPVYYGFNLSGTGLAVLGVGNEVRIVGSVQYYEAGGTWQVSDLSYRLMKPNDPSNIQKLSEGHSGAFRETDPATFVNGKVTLLLAEGEKTFDYAHLAQGTTVTMKGLTVTDVYTTSDPASSSKGAMTLTCRSGDVTVSVRTGVLYDETGHLVTAEAYRGKVIDVRGIVDLFDGTCQVKVFDAKDITINN